MIQFELSKTVNKEKIFMIYLSEIEGRLDPNPYHIERTSIIEKIEKLASKKLKNVTASNKVIVTEIDEDDIYIGLENIVSESGEYIETKEKKSISSAAKFKKGQILFPKLRPYLNKVYFAEFDGLCSTEFHVFDSVKLDAMYLAIYLSSNLVVSQTKHLMTGNTLPRLQTEDIEKIPVPIVTTTKQTEIVNKYKIAKHAKQLKEQKSKSLLASIDNYLLNELGIDLPENDNSLKNRIFETSWNKISGGRFDPKLYDNNTKALRQAITLNKYSNVPLKTLIIHSVAGDWGKDENEVLNDNYKKCLVIRATEFDNLYNLKLENSRVKYRQIHKDKLEKIDIQVNDLLIEKSGGSPDQPVGRIAFITMEILKENEICYSNFIHKIRVDSSKIHPEYLFCFLKTIHNIKLTDSMQSQTNGIRNLIMSNYFNQDIVIPVDEQGKIDINKQIEISNRIGDLRRQAKQLQIDAQKDMELAKQEIEHMILGE